MERKRESRIMEYLRQRAGSVKGRKPLRLGAGFRVSQKSRLRNIDEDIVRRQPLRQPLTLQGYSTPKDGVVTHRRTCRPDEDGSQPLRCPSNRDICLYDSLLCDGKKDCPNGEDETFSICVMRHWTWKILRRIDSMEKERKTV